MEPRQLIVNEILQERVGQTNKYSNMHDDGRTRRYQWTQLIGSYLKDVSMMSYRTSRRRLIQIAAMCICAIESIDRITGRHHEKEDG